jgi:hypothetical protein
LGNVEVVESGRLYPSLLIRTPMSVGLTYSLEPVNGSILLNEGNTKWAECAWSCCNARKINFELKPRIQLVHYDASSAEIVGNRQVYPDARDG